jgi:flagellum-specific ATP synthase
MNEISIDFSSFKKSKVLGKVLSSTGANIIAELPIASIGDIVTIESNNGSIVAEVLGFSENKVHLSPYTDIKGLTPGAKVTSGSNKEELKLSSNLVGSLTDANGNILIPSKINSNQIQLKGNYPLFSPPAELISREPINEPLWTGIRSIDAFTTIGKGQKLLMLAEPGVGKSSLLLSLCQSIEADLVIVALIGERGREVIEFHKELVAAGGDKKTIVVSSTSDTSPLLKKRAALTAIRMAEIARDQGLNVFLAFDSLTRYIRALRDIGLSAGQMPVRRGYPASVFDEIPKYIERSGKFSTGSITSIYTMLSSGELEDDPLVEEVKGLTDGHLILSRKLAEESHFPALHINQSLSRVARRFYDESDLQIIDSIRALYAELKESRDILLLGGDSKGITRTEDKLSLIKRFLVQNINCSYNSNDIHLDLSKLYQDLIT